MATKYKVSEIIKEPTKQFALDIQKRGQELTNVELTATDIMLIGLIDEVRELKEKMFKDSNNH